MAYKRKIRLLFFRYEDGIRKLVELEQIGLETLDDVIEYNDTLYTVYDIKQEIEKNVNSDIDWIEYDTAAQWLQRDRDYPRVGE